MPETVTPKVKFPIAIKLVTIITVLLLLSLGAITILVSYMVTRDVQITAEENNFSVNRQSASETERTLSAIGSAVFVLLEIIQDTARPETEDLIGRDSFFNHNEQVAAIIVPGFLELVNQGYFRANELDSGLPHQFLDQQTEALRRCAAGETILLNAAPFFQSAALVMLCPFKRGENAYAAAIFFSSDSLNDNYGQGVNSSFLINDTEDVLIHSDYEMVRGGANLADHPFVEILRDSTETSLQTLYTDKDGKRYFGAFQKLTIGSAALVTIVEYDKIFEGIVTTTRRNIYLTGVVLFASIILIWLFSKTISGPLKVLTAAAGEIEAGRFDLELMPGTRDEIGVLTASFGRMGSALGIFGRFTNRDIAIRAMRGQIHPGGEPKNATILFSDIRNFTSISEKFSEHLGGAASDRLVRWLNEYLTRMVSCVEKTGGVVDKFIGDAVMAHWGTAYTAGSPEHDALNCVRSALLMRAALYELNKKREPGDAANPVIKIGCGINSGMVTAGQIGSTERMEYTVIGDAVNLASRTEALNKPLGTDILITENTWNLVGRYLITEEMPPVTVKGKEKSIRLFAVINLKIKKGTQPKPRTLDEVRRSLGIDPPDMYKVNINAEEKKYTIGSGG
ncbi:MAG: adenylate/guanylate cyclase domain-containing protein [Spirochaetaceae bacterium]|jgi:adenylate cyclase|nr:adenylate/guanylate cyclase domain-containing protein [Spirochaetaceae bacterium]